MNRKIAVRYAAQSPAGSGSSMATMVFNAEQWSFEEGRLDIYQRDTTGKFVEKIACFAPGSWSHVSFQDD